MASNKNGTNRKVLVNTTNGSKSTNNLIEKRYGMLNLSAGICHGAISFGNSNMFLLYVCWVSNVVFCEMAHEIERNDRCIRAPLASSIHTFLGEKYNVGSDEKPRRKPKKMPVCCTVVMWYNKHQETHHSHYICFTNFQIVIPDVAPFLDKKGPSIPSFHATTKLNHNLHRS